MAINFAEKLFSERKLSCFNRESGMEIANMKLVIQHMKRLISTNKSFHIFGDYDVDGITSVAQLYMCLQDLGCEVQYTLPDRYYMGYGLSKNIRFDEDVIILVDTGIQANEPIEDLIAQGKEVIIIDHHQPSAQLPNTMYIIDPKCKFDTYPFKDHCASGLVNIVCKGLGTKVPEYKLDILAMLATIADNVPLIDENRQIVKNGIEALKEKGYLSLDILFNLCGINRINSENLSFKIIPCLNAPGRIDKPDKALEFLLCDDLTKSKELAYELLSLNEERKSLCNRYMYELSNITATSDIILIANSNIPVGIQGILAGMLCNKFNKPAIVTDGNKGSCRSPENIDILKILSELSECFIKFGGHKQAAGIVLKENYLPRLTYLCDKFKVSKVGSNSAYSYDLEVDLNDITEEEVKKLEILQPYGYGNEKPIFKTKNVPVKSYKFVGSSHDVLQLKTPLPNLKLVMFACKKVPSDKIDITYTLDLNEFRGRTYIQLQLIDFERSAS